MSITNGPFDNQNLYRSLNVIPSIAPTPKAKKRFLNASDSIFSLFLVAPLVISHWRGTWNLLDYYGNVLPPLNCIIFGATIHTTFAILREPLRNLKSKECIKTKIKICLIKILYTYLFSLGCIMHWRGSWAFAQELEGRLFPLFPPQYFY